MIVSNCDRGQIFLLPDKYTQMSRYHDYLVMGINEYERLGLVQCMGISSMRNKEVSFEVPIIMCNGYVSYIIPYNLHSFHHSEMDRRQYRGCVVNNSIMMKDEFLQFLMDLYLDSLGMMNHDEMVTRYNEYCDAFWKAHPDATEYREKDSVETVLEEKNDDADKELLSLAQTVHNTREAIAASTSSSSSSFRQNNRKEESTVKPSNEVTEAQIRSLKSTPRFLRDWSDHQLRTLIKGYRKFGGPRILELLPNRWATASTLWTTVNKCREEARQRGLTVEEKSDDTDKDPLKQPVAKWSDVDLRNYVAVLENHKHDKGFMKNYTGFTNDQAVYDLTYRVRKEMKSRNLV